MTSNPELTTTTYDAPPPPPFAAQPQPRLLRRSTDDKVLGGVCGGIARYLGVDAVLIRLLAVVLTIAGGGAGLIAYLVAWIVIPKDRTDDTSANQSTPVPSGGGP
jgi:phage shock protein C